MYLSQFFIRYLCAGLTVFLFSSIVIGVIYVPADYPTIQGAINAIDPNNDTIIIISPDTYCENISFNGKDIILTSTNPEDPNIIAATIIDGQQNGSVVTFAGSETSVCQLKGFTITNGYKEYPVPFGAGITGNGTKATIDSCIVRNNLLFDWTYSAFGAGIHDCDGLINNCIIQDNYGSSGEFSDHVGDGLASCDGMITRCIIANNSGRGLLYCEGTIDNCTFTGNIGAGIYNEYSSPAILNCTITGNSSGIYNNGVCPAITNCIITGNEFGINNDNDSCPVIANCMITENVYDGIANDYSSPEITNCAITGNGREGIRNYFGNPVIAVNCTIAGNGDYGIYNYRNSCTITNCIIWDNGNSIYNSNSTPVITYSDVAGGYSGTGNINVSPLFADADNGDYHLKSQYGRWNPGNKQWVYDAVTSPCIDAGNPEIISYWDPNGTPEDPNDDFFVEYPDPDALWHNELWPHGGRINMGTYGGTPQASMSGNPVGNVADLNHDDTVDLIDLVLFCDDWLASEYLLDTDLDRNNMVDIADFAVFTSQWLWIEP